MYVSHLATCKEPAACLASVPNSESIVSSLVMLFPCWKWAPIRTLPALAGASKDEVHSVLQGLRPLIAYYAVQEIVTFADPFPYPMSQGSIGIQPEPMDNIYKRALLSCKRLEPDHLGEALRHIVEHADNVLVMWCNRRQYQGCHAVDK